LSSHRLGAVDDPVDVPRPAAATSEEARESQAQALPRLASSAVLYHSAEYPPVATMLGNAFVAAWPDLPEVIKAGIVAMVKAAKG
jgi:hypothetical protein